jgi:transglutaminase-like putative cysteine protease
MDFAPGGGMYLRGNLNQYLGGLSSLQDIPDGPAGTTVTLETMRQLANAGKTYLPLRNLALDIVSHVPPKNWPREAAALHAYVRDQVIYRKDVHGVETVQTIPAMMQRTPMVGDCDDKATLLAAMLETLGHQARFVAAGRHPGRFEHVWVQTPINNQWVDMETTMKGWSLGRAPHDLPYKMYMEV